MRKTVLASALLASFVAAPAVSFAEDAAPAAPAFTSNVTLASEYIYRGIGQTNRKPPSRAASTTPIPAACTSAPGRPTSPG